jgi:diphthamide synthase (EF-2-diphthine--ammonia ligase)
MGCVVGKYTERLCITRESVVQFEVGCNSIQFLFRYAPERRMAQIVRESRRFYNIGVNAPKLPSKRGAVLHELFCQTACNLRD